MHLITKKSISKSISFSINNKSEFTKFVFIYDFDSIDLNTFEEGEGFRVVMEKEETYYEWFESVHFESIHYFLHFVQNDLIWYQKWHLWTGSCAFQVDVESRVIFWILWMKKRICLHTTPSTLLNPFLVVNLRNYKHNFSESSNDKSTFFFLKTFVQHSLDTSDFLFFPNLSCFLFLFWSTW